MRAGTTDVNIGCLPAALILVWLFAAALAMRLGWDAGGALFR